MRHLVLFLNTVYVVDATMKTKEMNFLSSGIFFFKKRRPFPFFLPEMRTSISFRDAADALFSISTVSLKDGPNSNEIT